MSQNYFLADVNIPPPKRQLCVDWKLCVICQEDTCESLTCPGNKTRTGEGYATFAKDLQAFKDAALLPESINLVHLSGESSLEDNFKANAAKFHKTCRHRFDNYKLQRALDRQDKAKRRGSDATCSSSGTPFTRSKEPTKNWNKTCFFCESSEGTLNCVATKSLSEKIHEYAVMLQDQRILAKISEGDLIAIEAQYHRNCLNKFCNRKRSIDRENEQNELESADFFSLAFAELTSYVQDTIICSEDIPVFELRSLVELFENRLEQLTEGKVSVHSTRLKDMLLNALPGLTAFKKGRDILLTINAKVGNAIQKACEFDAATDILKAAKLIRKIRSEAFNIKSNDVCALDKTSQIKSVSPLLLALTKMLLYGPNSKQQLENNARQEALTIAQLLTFNMKRSISSADTSRVEQSRETPFPMYLSLMVHAKTRKKELIDKFHAFGVGISYDRVLHISSALGQAACEFFEKAGVVCSPHFKKGEFITGAVDNIDLNPSSTTSVGAFHGTGISLQQHCISALEPESPSFILNSDSMKVPTLPEFYTNMDPVFENKVKKVVPELTPCLPIKYSQRDISDQTLNWVQHVERELLRNADSPDSISWAAFNSKFLSAREHPVKFLTHCQLLPMFTEVAHSYAMIAHSMKVVAAATNYLNQGQTPVITCDEPLYAIAKNLQWDFPEQFGEEKFVLMLGGLHVEKAIMSVLGNLLEGSGWVESLVEAGVTSSGRAQSFIHVSHITRTRYAHKVTLCALFLLQKEAYQNYIADEGDLNDNLTTSVPLSFEKWCQKNREASPQFLYWCLVMELEDSLLDFLVSVRSSNFELYKNSLTRFAPWFFTFNHYNYARWISVHIRDMLHLQNVHPTVYKEFLHGKFTANISGNLFSAMALDQAHEQCNAQVKGDGGAVGLTENPQALQRWMICGPEVARLLHEFEKNFSKAQRHQGSAPAPHHESSVKSQHLFSNDVRSLMQTIRTSGNPFEDIGAGIQNLHSRVIMQKVGVEQLHDLRKCGKEQFELFIKERFQDRSMPLAGPLKRNQVLLFNGMPSIKSKANLAIKSAKNDANLFARLYIVCQQRGSDLNEFFRHENQPYPPALSYYGQMKKNKKSELLECFRKMCDIPKEKPSSKCAILDGAAVVHMLPPQNCKVFDDYGNRFCNIVLKEWSHVNRLDVVWDDYKTDSLKAETRMNRGSGTRRKVSPLTPVPRNWNDFLKNEENKKELFSFLAEKIITQSTSTELIVTKKEGTISNNSGNRHEILSPCNHEEADSRIFLHARDANENGFKSVIIRTVDTDVVVLALANFHKFNFETMWVAFGTSKNIEFFPIHSLSQVLGVDKAEALPFFHALSGCDTTSSFTGHSKKTAWATFHNGSEFVNSFRALSQPSDSVSDFMVDIEKFVVLMYDKSSSSFSVNETRKELFTKKNRFFDRLPPTKAALHQHVLRSAYQAGHIWGQCLVSEPILPEPHQWGWKKSEESGSWEPIWSTLPEASVACRELLKCGCKSCATNRCKCKKAMLKCTMLCGCTDCENSADLDGYYNNLDVTDEYLDADFRQ